jgi:hypothetical protein
MRRRFEAGRKRATGEPAASLERKTGPKFSLIERLPDPPGLALMRALGLTLRLPPSNVFHSAKGKLICNRSA